MTAILGISAFYHDSAAALLVDGKIVAAAQEERFTRKKHDQGFPIRAIEYCLAEAGIAPDGLEAVVFYEKPITKFVRLLETYFSTAPRGLRSFQMAMPIWLTRKLWIPLEMEKALTRAGIRMPAKLYFPEHHESHAASAFYPSPYESAAILTVDGVGEWATSTLGHGRGADMRILKELRFPHSLGLLYSAFTYFCGFKVNSGEYKLMGLAPYGRPLYADAIRKNLVDLRDDGSFRLDMSYFDYLSGLRMTNRKFAGLFGGPERKPEAQITRREMDLAASIQVVTEDIVLHMARHLHKLTGEKNLCMAGGVALNCVANGRLQREGPFENIWIQPASGDAGGALGAALAAWHLAEKQPRPAPPPGRDAMSGSFLGPSYSDDEIGEYLAAKGYPAVRVPPGEWAAHVARIVAGEKVVGLFNGRMEFGPRALGGRSIIGDSRSPKMQSVMNLKIKYRESFRPFAPACLEEKVSEYFDLASPSPYMLIVQDVRKERLSGVARAPGTAMQEIINQVRSDIPAVTHVDNSARIQTVNHDQNPRFYDLLKAFDELTGCAVMINTSFNVRGEPIVCTPSDAYRCFMRTEMDYLVLGAHVLDKREQPVFEDNADWRKEFVLD